MEKNCEISEIYEPQKSALQYPNSSVIKTFLTVVQNNFSWKFSKLELSNTLLCPHLHNWSALLSMYKCQYTCIFLGKWHAWLLRPCPSIIPDGKCHNEKLNWYQLSKQNFSRNQVCNWFHNVVTKDECQALPCNLRNELPPATELNCCHHVNTSMTIH